MSKVMIAIPCMDQVPTPFMQSMAMLIKPTEHNFAMASRTGSLIYNSRNDLALQAMTTGFDWIFWLDSDMTFSPDILAKMLKTAEDFLSGLYFRRVQPYTPVAFDHLEVDEDGNCEWADLSEIPDDLFEVSGCGFGCALIKTSVFYAVNEKFKDMFMPIHHMGEDVAFCWRARQCGFHIWIDPNIELGHVGYTIINRKFYDFYSSVQESEDNKNEKSD